MTTITREHLELAAKAAEKHVICIPDKATGELVVHHQPGAFWQPWQPHIESLDTWRLAADCKMQVDFVGEKVQYVADGLPYIERFDSAANITAMEAVTLAAAEIGRAMG